MVIVEIVAKTNDPLREIQKDVDANIEAIRAELNEVGLETAFKMKQVIADNKKRPQSDEPTDLETAIYVEYFDDGWGVGDIEHLNEAVGYWAAINWGSSHMVGRRVPDGYFAPGTPQPTPDAFRQGRWKTDDLQTTGIPGGNTGFPGTGKAHWSFIVGQAIPPMNYIEKTSDWLDGRIDEINISE